MSEEQPSSPPRSTEYSFYTPRSLRRKNLWLIKLRWIATAIAFSLVLLAQFLIPGKQPLPQLFSTVGALVLINLLYTWYHRQHVPSDLDKEMVFVRVQIVIDLFLLTMLIHYSGGIENPFYLFYIFHIIIASTIFEQKSEPFIITIVAAVFFSTLILSEYYGLLPHHHIFVGTSYSPLSVFVSLGVFYVTIFVSAYLGVTLVSRHVKVKNLITEKNRQLEESAQSKMKLFRFISHELKSPIVAIQSSINVVLDVLGESLTEQSRDLLLRARNRTVQMLNIIKELLELSYERMPDESIKSELVNPCDYLIGLIDNEKPKAQAKDIEIIQNICAGHQDQKLNRFILDKILSNLISNAIRYTPSGGQVTITTNLADHCWTFRIADTGIGISPEDQEHIFEEFYRGKNAREFEAVGTGLGMSIVKKFVEQLHGDISVESEPGKGTTVTVNIPI
ncbi:MAG: HAMP domain-containing histidine kinase [FCB group bacterium]|nr:HAMP domain-containing histidine kinase [FCB group bacterium]